MNAHERAEKLCREAESTGLDNPTEGMIADAFSDMEFNHQQEVSRLRKALAEARKDSARLDWLEANWEQVFQRVSAPGFFYFDKKEERQKHQPTIRAAIDDAMPLPATPHPETEGTI